MEPLQPQLDGTTNYFLENLPKEVNATFQEVLDTALEKHIAENTLKIGDRMEDFVLPTSNGGTFSLYEKLTEGPVVLTFYRGSWCPYCNLTLKAYEDALPEIKDLGASLVAVTPEFPEKAQETVTKEGIQFNVVTDSHNQLAEKLGLLFYQDDIAVSTMKELGFDMEIYYGKDEGNILPIPATFIIKTDGKLAFSYINPNYRFRAEPGEVLKVLKTIS
ncbi:MAG: peroxiredoxin-like family protein [Bacteroidota bacterium]